MVFGFGVRSVLLNHKLILFRRKVVKFLLKLRFRLILTRALFTKFRTFGRNKLQFLRAIVITSKFKLSLNSKAFLKSERSRRDMFVKRNSHDSVSCRYFHYQLVHITRLI